MDGVIMFFSTRVNSNKFMTDLVAKVMENQAENPASN